MGKFLTPEHEEADRLLQELGQCDRQLTARRALAEAELEQLRRRHQDVLSRWEVQRAAAEKELLALEKRHWPVFFEGDSCKVELPHGALLYALSHYVKKAKAVTCEKLEEMGFPEAVKIVKSVDWDILSDWPDARLFLVGTERVPKETYGYEVKGLPPLEEE